MNKILDERKVYKPFSHPKFFDIYKKHEQSIWFPTEVPMADDLADFNGKLSKDEKFLINNILRFFTQGDIEVNNNYNTHLVNKFKIPEVNMMLSSFAARESIHVWAYSQLNDSLGIPDSEYNLFLEYEEMKNKHEFMNSFNVNTTEELIKNMAVFGGFIEGVSLFASFAILMNFPRRNLLKNVGQIVSWSVLDEDQHSKGVCEIVTTILREYPEYDTAELEFYIKDSAKQVVDLEDKFIELCYGAGAIEGLSQDNLKKYIRYMANERLKQLGYTGIYKVETNPLPWMLSMVYGKEHANFFEARATEYAKGSIEGDWF